MISAPNLSIQELKEAKKSYRSYNNIENIIREKEQKILEKKLKKISNHTHTETETDNDLDNNPHCETAV